MVQIPEAQRDATQVLQPTVDSLDRAVGRADVEIRQDVVTAARQRPTELRKLLHPACRLLRSMLISRFINFLRSDLDGCEYAAMTS